jgi:hypothetical protein
MTIFITIFEQNRLSSWQSSTKLSEVNVKDTFTSHIDKKIFLTFLVTPYLYVLPNGRLEITKKSFFLSTTRDWHNLSPEIRNSGSLFQYPFFILSKLFLFHGIPSSSKCHKIVIYKVSKIIPMPNKIGIAASPLIM